MANYVTGQKLAELLSEREGKYVNPALVSMAKKKGRIKTEKVNGKELYDADTQVDAYFNNRCQMTIRKDLIVDKPKETISIDSLTNEQIESLIQSDGLLSITDADRLKKTYEGKLAKLKFETEEGKVVAIDEVAKTVENEYSLVRARLRAISSTLAPMLALEDSEKKCRAIIDEAVEDCLKELSAYGK